jgi:hypothetical protein
LSATVFYNASAELATCANVFSVAGTPTDPTAVTLVITDPAGVVVTYNWPGGPGTLTRVSAGSFTQDVPCASTADGLWQGVWTGTGTASDVQGFTWTVQPVTIGRWYTSLEEVKSRLGIGDTKDDFEIQGAVQAAARWIEGRTGRYFWRAADTRTYIPQDLYRTRIDDLVSVTALATDPSGTAPTGGTFPVSWPSTAYQLLPYNPGKTGEPWPYTSIRAVGGLTFPYVIPLILMRMDRVQVTGVFGWPQVPQAIRQAALLLASDIFKLKDAPFGIAGSPVELGAIRIPGVTAQVEALVSPYVAYRGRIAL